MLPKKVISTLFAGLILLTACGGSDDTESDVVNDNGSNVGEVTDGDVSNGSVNDDDNNSLFKFQTFGLERIEYDYDNNGIAEGVETFNYDNAGKLVLKSFQYTADGTPDPNSTRGGPSRGLMFYEVTYTYDEMGRLVSSQDIAISNTSQEAGFVWPSRTINFTFEYKDDLEYPMSITENYLDEGGVPIYGYTDVFDYDEDNNLISIIRNYDPSISTFPIDNPGYLYRVEFNYSDTIGSAPNYNYLDEFMVATIFNYSPDGLINSTIVTSDPTLSIPPPELSSIIEHSYNDRNCINKFTFGRYNDSGTIDYIASNDITYGSQDRPILKEFDDDLDGNIDSTQRSYYGDIASTTAPYEAGLFGYPHLYRQGQKTNCLID